MLRRFAFARPSGRLALLLALALPAPLFAQTAPRTITATAGGASTGLAATSDPSRPPPGGVAAPLPERDDDGDGLTYFEEMQRGSNPLRLGATTPSPPRANTVPPP